MPFPKASVPPLSRLYHFNSKLEASRPFYITDTAIKSVNGSFIDFEGRPRVQPDFEPSNVAELDRLLDGRTSTRTFAGTVGVDRLGTILRRATRINRARVSEAGILSAKRVYPSPGGLYPVEPYVAALGVAGLNRSIYHWNVLDECFEELWPLPPFDMLEALPGIQPSNDVPAAAILLTAYFPRLEWKYGERSYRFVMLEAGGIAQNVQTIAVDHDTACRWVGGYKDDYWNDALRIDGHQETTVLAIAIG